MCRYNKLYITAGHMSGIFTDYTIEVIQLLITTPSKSKLVTYHILWFVGN